MVMVNSAYMMLQSCAKQKFNVSEEDAEQFGVLRPELGVQYRVEAEQLLEVWENLPSQCEQMSRLFMLKGKAVLSGQS